MCIRDRSSLAQVRLSRQNWIGAEQVAEAIKRLGARGDTAEQIKAAALSGEKKYDQSISLLEDAYASNKGAVQPMYALVRACLLYTSDAADEEDSVDLGGRRIIKK